MATDVGFREAIIHVDSVVADCIGYRLWQPRWWLFLSSMLCHDCSPSPACRLTYHIHQGVPAAQIKEGPSDLTHPRNVTEEDRLVRHDITSSNHTRLKSTLFM